MNRTYVGIIALICIFIISGSYAIFNGDFGNDTIQNEPITDTIVSDTIITDTILSDIQIEEKDISEIASANTLEKSIISNPELTNITENIKDSNITSKSYEDIIDIYEYKSNFPYRPIVQIKPIYSLDSMRNIPGTNLSVPSSIDLTDRWSQCICGGFNAVGNITKSLPEEAICPDACGAISGTGGPYYSYDKALEIWNENPQRIVDPQHLNGNDRINFNQEEPSASPSIDLISEDVQTQNEGSEWIKYPIY